MNFKIYIKDVDFAQTLDFYIVQESEEGIRYLCKDLKSMEFAKINEGQYVTEPTFSIKGRIYKPFLQAMADELHRIGINPSQKPILENELTAVKFHLDDMRKLVFKGRIK